MCLFSLFVLHSKSDLIIIHDSFVQVPDCLPDRCGSGLVAWLLLTKWKTLYAMSPMHIDTPKFPLFLFLALAPILVMQRDASFL